MTTPLKRKAADLAAASPKKPKPHASITSFFTAPKPAATSTIATPGTSSTTSSTTVPASQQTQSLPALPIAKFDKEKWVEKLSAEQKELLKLEIDTLHESWLAQLKDEVLSKEFLELKRFLKRELEAGKKVFPPGEDVYSWCVPCELPPVRLLFDLTVSARSRHTPLPTVKAVVLGQDPYHNINQAHGLCFSVRPPTPAPPSLKNVYIALAKDYPSFKPPPKNGGLLTPWADRGVLLLNTCLTVRAHEANSHAGKGWEKFTQKVIDVVAKTRTKGVVFLAWGSPAGKRVAKIDRQRHCILQSVHPSPLSAHKGFVSSPS